MFIEGILRFWKRDPSESEQVNQTRLAYLWSYILYTPFWGIYNMLPFILYKDLHATPLQIALLITLKPVVSIFSLYWSAHVAKRRDRLKKNIILAGILGNVPFFLYPWMDSVWYFVLSAALFMLLARGVVPAWMEILKLNLSSSLRNKAFAYGSALCYAVSGLFPLLFGWLMDEHVQVWRWIFPLTALISLSTIWLQLRIPIPSNTPVYPAQEPSSSWNLIVKPWKEALSLLKGRPDYALYQIGLMLAGFGVMLWQPALPLFFMDTLDLSYTKLATAIAFCKGIGYVMASPAWANVFNRPMIFRMYGVVSFLFCLFPLLLMLAAVNVMWLYIAYILYGITQSASEMSWSLSGPVFARDQEDSSVYSSLNILSVGLRGCVAPPLGSYLLGISGSRSAMLLGSFLCLLATLHMFACSRRRVDLPVKT